MIGLRQAIEPKCALVADAPAVATADGKHILSGRNHLRVAVTSQHTEHDPDEIMEKVIGQTIQFGRRRRQRVSELSGIPMGVEGNLLGFLAVAGAPSLHAAQRGQRNARQFTITDRTSRHARVDKGKLLRRNARCRGYLCEHLLFEALLVFSRLGHADITFELIRFRCKIFAPTGIHPRHGTGQQFLEPPLPLCGAYRFQSENQWIDLVRLLVGNQGDLLFGLGP